MSQRLILISLPPGQIPANYGDDATEFPVGHGDLAALRGKRVISHALTPQVNGQMLASFVVEDYGTEV